MSLGVDTPFSETWTGTGLPGYAAAFAADVQQGDWIAASVDGLGAVATSVSAMIDPLGELVKHGVGFLLENLHPLCDWFDDFTGHPDRVRALADEWAALGAGVDATIEDYWRDVDRDMAGMIGPHALRYRVHAAGLYAHGNAVAVLCTVVAQAVEQCATIVQVVHDLIREAISEVVAMVISAGGWTLASGGALLPKVVLDVIRRVARLAGSLGPRVAGALDTIADLAKLLTRHDRLMHDGVVQLTEMATRARLAHAAAPVVDRAGLFATVTSPAAPRTADG